MLSQMTARAASGTRQRILDAGAAMLSEGPLTSVDMARLAKRAEVDPATVWRHLGDNERGKRALVQALIEERGITAAMHVAPNGEETAQFIADTVQTVRDGWCTHAPVLLAAFELATHDWDFQRQWRPELLDTQVRYVVDLVREHHVASGQWPNRFLDMDAALGSDLQARGDDDERAKEYLRGHVAFWLDGSHRRFADLFREPDRTEAQVDAAHRALVTFGTRSLVAD